jgi:dTMP kinase
MRQSKKGLFITFEGTEGAGKSTLIRAFSKQLRQKKIKVCLTREPGGPSLSEKIRHLILKEKMAPWTELFLYEAARYEHVSRTIRPALERGAVVLCDRFTDSSLAYQGYARGIDWKDVALVNQLAIQGTEPDFTVFLDIDPAEGLKKAQVQTRFEKEGIAFQKKVRKGYLKARAENPSRWITLKTQSGTPEELSKKLIHILSQEISKTLSETHKNSFFSLKRIQKHV